MCTLVLAMAFGLNGCKKKDVAEETPAEETPATPAPKAATPEPAKPVAVATPPPATPAPELAPPGVFYLITAVSVETSDGILGLKPGQLLKEVRPGVYRADTNEVTLRPDQVTNDMAVARRFAAQDQRNQAAIQQRLAASAPAAPSATGAPSTESRPLAPPSAQEDPKVKARQELMQQRMAIQQQENALAVTLNQASLRYGNWEAAAKKSPQAYQLLQQFNALRRQGENLDAQISNIR